MTENQICLYKIQYQRNTDVNLNEANEYHYDY